MFFENFHRLVQSAPSKKERELEDLARTVLEILGNLTLSTRAAEALRAASKRLGEVVAKRQEIKGNNSFSTLQTETRVFN